MAGEKGVGHPFREQRGEHGRGHHGRLRVRLPRRPERRRAPDGEVLAREDHGKGDNDRQSVVAMFLNALHI